MRLKPLLQSAGISRKNNCHDQDFEIKGVSANSREVGKGFIFVAVKGARADGSKFIQEAIKRGARVIITPNSKLRTPNSQSVIFIVTKDTRRAIARLAAEFYGNPSQNLKIVGVTGTNGKTTVTYLIEAILKEAGKNPAVLGTINYRFNNQRLPAKNTTPGPVELQSILARMRRAGVNYAVMEVSSHALDQQRTEGVKFHSAIFTNLTQDHLDYHKTKEKYFQAKARLFRALNPGAFALINNDDPYAARLRKITPADVATYAIENKADYLATEIRFHATHTEFTLFTSKTRERFKINLLGRHNVYNTLAAIAWGLKAGIPLSRIKKALEKFSVVPGRLERIGWPGNFTVLVDYAHTEDALRNVLECLKDISQKRIIVVFGCGGERDKTKRPKMGRVVTDCADYAIITSDNPRSESPLEIIRQIKKGIRKDNFCVIPQRLEAIKRSLGLARSGDVVLVAGKGHEDYQILGNKKIHFDDREVIRKCLRLMK